MNRSALLVALLGVLAGCAVSQQSGEVNTPNRQVGISWIRGEWKTCEEGGNCPRPTPKTVRLVAPVVMPESPKAAEVVKQADKVEIKRQAIIVHFGFASSTPTNAGIGELKKALKAIKDDDVLRIVGYTDDIGSSAFNDQLAMKRAQYVAAWLKRNGVKNLMRTEAKGKCCYLQPNDSDSGRVANRRVEIHYATTEKEMSGDS